MTEPTSEAPTHQLRVYVKMTGDTTSTVTIKEDTAEECAVMAERLIRSGLIDNVAVRPRENYTGVAGETLLSTLMEYALAYIATLENKTTEQEK